MVQPHDVAHLRNQQRVRRQLERLAPMRLQAKGAPHATDRHMTEAGRLRHLARAPVRRAARRRFQRADNHRLDLRVGDLARRAGTRFVEQARHAIGHEPRAPLTHRRLRHPQASSDRRVVAALGARQHEARASRQGGRRSRSMGQRFQFLSFLRRQHQGSFGAADAMRDSPSSCHTTAAAMLFHIFLLQDTSASPLDR